MATITLGNSKRVMLLAHCSDVYSGDSVESYRACSQENQDYLEAVSATFKEQKLDMVMEHGR